jgi:large subunit ribosomal protein L21
MYAVVETGGKQYKVAVDLKISVEYLSSAEVGSTIELPCLMFSDDSKVLVGKDAEKVTVQAKVLQHGKGKKLNIFTYKPKKNIRKRQGHRQPFTQLQITKIAAK